MSKDQNVIKANPTKSFFIDMLTRDIRLDRAIIDLADNCIDGAKNLKKSNQNYDGLEVDITLSKSQFRIWDNCGGFSLDVAKNYAFMFGRPNDPKAKFVDHSIGRFGVGMKRALFKMGKHFLIESRNAEDYFLIEINVDEWIKDEDDWMFSYLEHDDIPTEKRLLNGQDGTVITISDLYPTISDELCNREFQAKLSRELGLALSYSILKNLEIRINDQPINRTDISFLEKDGLKPLYIQKTISDVDVRIYAGVGSYSPSHAGWYVFCNDRMVLEADKSFTTGWKETKEDEGNIIKYHNDYAMFRGAIFFSAKDSSKLPMTTTKTGIDSDHPVFKSARPTMLTAMKQVINFLKKLEDKDEGESIINDSEKIEIMEIKDHVKNYSETFTFPTTKAQKEANKYVGISYKKDKAKVEKLKDFLGVSANGEVGSITFDYYCKMNEID